MAAEGYDYDLFIIGGGSGGLAASKAAASCPSKPKVAVADFVKPSTQGTKWGLGGTCVNVGCIPKKLMHLGALYRDAQSDYAGLGWDTRASHSWEQLVDNIDDYIRGINYAYKTELRDKKVEYFNSYATFVDPHTVTLDNGKGKVQTVTSKYFIIACGGRPTVMDTPGALECCHTSDDIFWRKQVPGKTLVIGASYIALECAGFLAGYGFDVTVMVRSILLRGFDQDIASKIGEHMEKHGVKFARKMEASKFEKTADGKVKVFVAGNEYDTYDTVLLAVGRNGCAGLLNLEAAGVTVERGKIKCDHADKSNVDHIFAIGDVSEGKPELTPVAIQAGKLLAHRLFAGSHKLMDYINVATTVFTPLEYGACGMSEEEAIKALGKDSVVCYHSYAIPLEWNTNPKRKDVAYLKVICNRLEREKVIGVHILGPNAGEIVQGLAVALKAGVTKEILDDTVGIHPTLAEAVCDLTEIKEEGKVLALPKGC